MSIEKVRSYLTKYGFDERIQEFDVSSATVELAAAALGCEGKRIAKSLTFLVDGQAVMIVAAGDVKVDNRKFKDRFHQKATMLTAGQVETLIGHNDGVSVYLDESLRRFETVFPACGSSNSAIELTIPELEKLSGYQEWVDVCKIRQAE